LGQKPPPYVSQALGLWLIDETADEHEPMAPMHSEQPGHDLTGQKRGMMSTRRILQSAG
jgi:hypothetical protein